MHRSLSHEAQEAIELVIEEASEVIKALTKIARFGFDANYPDGTSNTAALQQELGDFSLATDILVENTRVSHNDIRMAKIQKYARIVHHLHYVELPDDINILYDTLEEVSDALPPGELKDRVINVLDKY